MSQDTENEPGVCGREGLYRYAHTHLHTYGESEDSTAVDRIWTDGDADEFTVQAQERGKDGPKQRVVRKNVAWG